MKKYSPVLVQRQDRKELVGVDITERHDGELYLVADVDKIINDAYECCAALKEVEAERDKAQAQLADAKAEMLKTHNVIYKETSEEFMENMSTASLNAAADKLWILVYPISPPEPDANTYHTTTDARDVSPSGHSACGDTPDLEDVSFLRHPP